MKKYLSLIILLSVSIIGSSQNKSIRHILNVRVEPAKAFINVNDTIFISGEEELVMNLNSVLSVTSFSGNVKAEKIGGSVNAKDVGMDRDDSGESRGGVKLNKWKLKLKRGAEYFVVNYEGKIDIPVSSGAEDYARGFSETTGIIGKQGVYLAGSTHWVPSLGDNLVTFQLNVILPEGWKSVSQGKRTYESGSGGMQSDIWLCDAPQEEVFLVAAPFTEYGFKMNNGVDAMAFLRTPDQSLANKYLDVTEQFMNMYQDLIGPFPYTKFALVENFWETGYGMPSFTLLGEKIIRFPFILYSSYPHELLHNWWGNSVYVDFDKGNWCEGITAYGADHLISEQRGQGEEYRRSTLQKFTNVVDESNDFPLNRFISRHNAASEAIGYGKSLMMWHMLRRKVGDDNFKKGFALFYKNYKFKMASFDDIRKSFEEVTNTNLEAFFKQWLTRNGAPEIAIDQVNNIRIDGQYQITLTLKQKQKDEPFVLDIPVSIVTGKGLQTFVVTMKDRTQEFNFSLNDEPLKLEVDPQYDVFRIMDPMEVPPTWSKVLASKENLVVLPSRADEKKKKLYTDFFEQWKAVDNDQFEVVYDDKVNALPGDKTVWIIGFENKFADKINNNISKFKSSILGDSVIYQGVPTSKANHSFVMTIYNPENSNMNMAFIAIDNENAIQGLITKLPHYGKYSYLGFEGDEPVNVAKGEWPVSDSPLVKVFESSAQNTAMFKNREPLATLPPVFSEQRMMSTIKYLASDELKGRGLGTPELDAAANYITDKFEEYGLKPMDKSYFQEFSHSFHGKGELQMKNVIGIIPGIDPKLKDSPVVLSAHYDHLGQGWPDVHSGDEGKIHHGADDNASGVSILIELAKSMGTSLNPKRTIIFVAFTGEEAGLVGSRYFVDQIKKHFEGDVIANVNLDTNGSLFDKKLLVLNGNSAKEWKFVFMGTDYTTGVKSEVVQQELDASDQVAFIEKGIPAVQLFTGATENYHRPDDTWKKIDGKGLVKVAMVAREVITYLAERDTPFEFTGKITGENEGGIDKPKSNRTASTGSIPDFSYADGGVKIASVVEGSAGDKAGLKSGDIITVLNGTEVNDLRTYSNELKKYQPGDIVELKILRDGKAMNLSITLGER
ncbi:MAG: M20/M25/M40 family metallo-hydrolase [Draconibacterium sp.]